MKTSTLTSEATGYTYALTLSDDRRTCDVAWTDDRRGCWSSTLNLGCTGDILWRGWALDGVTELATTIEQLVLCELRDRTAEFALMSTKHSDPPRAVFVAATAYLISQHVVEPMALPTIAFHATEVVGEIRNRNRVKSATRVVQTMLALGHVQAAVDDLLSIGLGQTELLNILASISSVDATGFVLERERANEAAEILKARVVDSEGSK